MSEPKETTHRRVHLRPEVVESLLAGATSIDWTEGDIEILHINEAAKELQAFYDHCPVTIEGENEHGERTTN